MEGLKPISRILQAHIDQMSQNLDSISEGSSFLQLQFFEEALMIYMASKASEVFANENILLELENPIIIVGDIHGHLLDLYRIIKKFDLPPQSKYLFLGDLVDRGPFSVECLSLVFSLKILFPDHVYIIRGNHEFESVSAMGGFFTETTSIYHNTNVFNSFIAAFMNMPIAARIGGALCLHGGLSPDFKKINQIEKIERPISDYSSSILSGILWSDPSNEPYMFRSSRRGTGFFFGEAPLIQFLRNNELKVLIRGHECVNGVESRWGGKLITVFSASNYCGETKNSSGVLIIDENGNLIPFLFKPAKFISRNDTQVNSKDASITRCTSLQVSLSSRSNASLLSPLMEAEHEKSIQGGVSLSKLPEILNRKRVIPKKRRMSGMEFVPLAVAHLYV